MAAKAGTKGKAKTPAKKAATKTTDKSTSSKTAGTKSTPKKKPAAKKTPATKKATARKSSGSSSKASSAGGSVDSQFRNFTPYEPKKGEMYMSDEQLVHFKQMLNNWRLELMEEVDRTVHHMQDEAANFPDPADRATQEEEFSIELRTRDRERKLIKKIDQTIERVDQEDYGYCDTCGIEIGLRRLEARPTATQCVDCKSLDEIKEKQIRG